MDDWTAPGAEALALKRPPGCKQKRARGSLCGGAPCPPGRGFRGFPTGGGIDYDSSPGEWMGTLPRLAIGVCFALSALTLGCASAPPSQQGLHKTPPTLGVLPYSDADVEFMSGMIPHHAQAVVMAGWAPTHGARKDVAILCERIVVAQRDEIALMQTWLRDRGLPVPDATSTKMKMSMNGTEHEMLMPGMLTDE